MHSEAHRLEIRSASASTFFPICRKSQDHQSQAVLISQGCGKAINFIDRSHAFYNPDASQSSRGNTLSSNLQRPEAKKGFNLSSESDDHAQLVTDSLISSHPNLDLDPACREDHLSAVLLLIFC
jgi:hypothetical protein